MPRGLKMPRCGFQSGRTGTHAWRKSCAASRSTFWRCAQARRAPGSAGARGSRSKTCPGGGGPERHRRGGVAGARPTYRAGERPVAERCVRARHPAACNCGSRSRLHYELAQPLAGRKRLLARHGKARPLANRRSRRMSKNTGSWGALLLNDAATVISARGESLGRSFATSRARTPARPEHADNARHQRPGATAASLAFGRRDHRRPSFLSLAFARFRPASTRARITTRSNSAKTPIIWNIALPS
jgi:hypothetical protein